MVTDDDWGGLHVSSKAGTHGSPSRAAGINGKSRDPAGNRVYLWGKLEFFLGIQDLLHSHVYLFFLTVSVECAFLWVVSAGVVVLPGRYATITIFMGRWFSVWFSHFNPTVSVPLDLRSKISTFSRWSAEVPPTWRRSFKRSARCAWWRRWKSPASCLFRCGMRVDPQGLRCLSKHIFELWIPTVPI